MLSFDLLITAILIIAAVVMVAKATMAMTIGYSIADAVGGDSGLLAQSFSTTQTGETAIIKTFTVPALTTDEDNEITFTVANLKMMVISSDRDITIKENSSGTPTATFTIKAGVPFEWHKDGGITIPFVGTAGVVNKFYISNAHATLAATVKVRGLA